jgi:sugar phosphate isomerase/epimerase
MELSSKLHLTYCTNIHPGSGWDEVRANLERIAPRLKAALSPAAPFGLGLRLSAREATELLDGDRLDRFRAFLDREGLYVALINGFPYGAFHGAPVKTNVYAPDWRDPARLAYTLDLIAILRRLLPAGIVGGISTSPLSYKAWLAAAGPAAWETIAGHLTQVAAALVDVQRRTGALIHLDVEPEPDCSLETIDETIDFFGRWLRPVATARLSAQFGFDAAESARTLHRHIGVCFDCCHSAVEFEEPHTALRKLADAGILIGRIQLSSAVKVDLPPDATGARGMARRLGAFADTTYLHQVVERRGDRLRHFDDLDAALATAGEPAARQWRIHFHVPLFTDAYDGLGSTRDHVSAVLAAVSRAPVTHHLEIETYTWDVLPSGLKIDVAQSIEREYRWVLDEIERLARVG